MKLAPAPHAAAYLPAEARAAFAAEAAATPEWQPWLALVESALAAADEPVWREAGIHLARARPAAAPVLEDAHVRVDAAAAVTLVSTLLAHAGAGRAVATAADAVAVVAAGFAHDAGAVERCAARLGVPAAPLASVAHFAALPLLLAAGHLTQDIMPPAWPAGYCPVCGAWPMLAELRGLERSRVLRCGRCATGWVREVLCCTFCDERDHRRQGALVPAGSGEFVRIETCDACRGCLKVVTTLRAKPVWALYLDDLRTLPLELRAREQAFARPAGAGWLLSASCTPAEPR